MNKFEHWLLPEGIEEALPEQAACLEALRRRLLDTFKSWGYELVMPPMVEYLESLLVGAGHDLDLQTFKLIDQMTGRLMGVRADITPQVARIDAHQIKSKTPTRLCYAGTVLHALADGFAGSRAPLQVGAELYGHTGVESEIEVLALMLETLELAAIHDVYIDIGHVGIYRGLANQAGLHEGQEAALFDMLQRKALPEINAYLQALELEEKHRRMLVSLAELNGGADTLLRAREVLLEADAAVLKALDYLQMTAQGLQARKPGVSLHFDLAELRGYHYHTGVVFAAFVAGQGQEIARGGRYNNIGKVFGRARPATGFSTDLKMLVNLGNGGAHSALASGIFAPISDDPQRRKEIEKLRALGERVIEELPSQAGGAQDMGCDRVLVNIDGQWQVVKGE